MSVPLAKHKQRTNRSKKSKQQNKVCKKVPVTPGCSLLHSNLVPSFCPFLICNDHLSPLIKGIIIYNFLLKNQLCILSVAGKNSQLSDMAGKNSSLWKEKKKAALKPFIYRHAVELSQIKKISYNVLK